MRFIVSLLTFFFFEEGSIQLWKFSCVFYNFCYAVLTLICKMDLERVVPTDILDDLCCRFVINVPEEERKDLNRIFFQIENAHWFYIDFYSKNFPHRKPCMLREFAHQVFRHIPFLQPFSGNVDEIFEEWKEYKFCVPTFGAILLDEDLSNILLVQNYRSSWGFPKGKVNKDEPPYQCAIREVYEETGFDITHLIDTNDYLECNVNKQIIRLYIIPGVKKNEKFAPKTRNEIKSVNWFPICDIPLNKKDALMKQFKTGSGANTFYMVSPFLKKIRQWIYDYNTKPRKQYLRQRHRSCSDIDYERNKGTNFDLKESIEKLQGLKRPEKDSADSNKAIVDMSEDDTIPTKLVSANSARPIPGILKLNTALPEVLPESIPTLPAINEINNPNEARINLIKNDDNVNQFINTSFDYSTKFKFPSSSSTFNISSDASAFRIVDMSKRESRRRQGRKDFGMYTKPEEYLSSFIRTADNAEKESPLKNEDGNITLLHFKPLECIPGWTNFRFDINAILESMNAAAAEKNVKTNVNR